MDLLTFKSCRELSFHEIVTFSSFNFQKKQKIESSVYIWEVMLCFLQTSKQKLFLKGSK